MPARLNPYLSFSGNARDAMEFYREVFGGDLTVRTYGDFGQGSVAVPLEQQMWGDLFGQCTDRYGIAWMVNIASTGAAE